MAKLHTVSKISIMFMLSVALSSAQFEWSAPRSFSHLFNVNPHHGWATRPTGLPSGVHQPSSSLQLTNRDRFVYFDRPSDIVHPLAVPARDDSDWRDALTLAVPPTPSADLFDVTTGRSHESVGKPLIVYSNNGNSKWNKFRIGAEPIQTVSAIIRAPSARLLSDSGKQTVLVSGPLPKVAKPLEVISRGEDQLETPKQYAFAYDTTDEFNNKQARQEHQDENGRVVGFYTYLDANGQSRLVNYIADENGFRADVKTNEPGTITSAPASAAIESAAPQPALHHHHAPGRAVATPVSYGVGARPLASPIGRSHYGPLSGHFGGLPFGQFGPLSGEFSPIAAPHIARGYYNKKAKK